MVATLVVADSSLRELSRLSGSPGGDAERRGSWFPRRAWEPGRARRGGGFSFHYINVELRLLHGRHVTVEQRGGTHDQVVARSRRRGRRHFQHQLRLV